MLKSNREIVEIQVYDLKTLYIINPNEFKERQQQTILKLIYCKFIKPTVLFD